MLQSRRILTQVIQAPLSLPNAISQAGSSDWKYSSGWKKVLMLSASSTLNAMRKMRTSCAVAVDFARCHTRCAALFALPLMSPSTFVEASEVGVVDIVYSGAEARRSCLREVGGDP